MDASGQRRGIAWGHAALLALFLAFIAWYVTDTVLASSRVSNLLFIVPVGAAAAIIGVFLMVRVLAGAEPRVEDGARVADDFRHRHGIPATMAAMVVFVVLLGTGWFDLATFLFVAATMWIYGARNPLAILGYAAAFALVVVAGMKHVLFVPVPTLLPL